MPILIIATLAVLTGCGQVGLEFMPTPPSESPRTPDEPALDIDWQIGHLDDSMTLEVEGRDEDGKAAVFRIHAEDPTVSRGMSLEMVYPEKGTLLFDQNGNVDLATLPDSAPELIESLLDHTIGQLDIDDETTEPFCDQLIVQVVTTCALDGFSDSDCTMSRLELLDRCASLPDLVMAGYVQDDESPFIQVLIENKGGMAATPFGVGLWAKESAASSCGAGLDAWTPVVEELRPNERTIVRLALPELEPGLNTLQLIIDPDCEVMEHSFGGEDNAWSIVVDVRGPAPACDNDSMEPNDTFILSGPSAIPLISGGIHHGLELCPDDLDWYRTGGAKTVQITFGGQRANLDLAAYDPVTGKAFMVSHGIESTESVQLPNRDALIMVYSPDGDSAPYTLCIDTEDCPSP